MALSRSFLSAPAAFGDGTQIHGGVRDAGHSAARHHSRDRSRAAAVAGFEVGGPGRDPCRERPLPVFLPSGSFVVLKAPVLQEVGWDIFLIFILPNPLLQRERVLVLVWAKTQDCYDMIERSRFTHGASYS